MGQTPAAVIENGATWLAPLLDIMADVYKKAPEGFAGDPISLPILDKAIEELEWCVERDADHSRAVRGDPYWRPFALVRDNAKMVAPLTVAIR